MMDQVIIYIHGQGGNADEAKHYEALFKNQKVIGIDYKSETPWEVAMNRAISKLTVYFEDPFWIGIFELIENGKMSVCKVTFGAEPKDYEIQEFVLKNYYSLQFSPAVTMVVKETKKNPKRMQREAKKQLQNAGVGTKSQEALKLQHEQFKQERKIRSKEQKEAEEQRMFELKQLKRLEKHKGH